MQRLKSRAQFQAVLAGHTVARTPHFALHKLKLTGAAPQTSVSAKDIPLAPPLDLFPVCKASVGTSGHVAWLGAMVPKRWAKRAVTRNTIKRQVYVLAELCEPPLPVAAYVLRLRAGFDKKQFISASSELLKQAVRVELTALLALAASKPVSQASKSLERTEVRP